MTSGTRVALNALGDKKKASPGGDDNDNAYILSEDPEQKRPKKNKKADRGGPRWVRDGERNFENRAGGNTDSKEP